jgi:hypothetical protein
MVLGATESSADATRNCKYSTAAEANLWTQRLLGKGGVLLCSTKLGGEGMEVHHQHKRKSAAMWAAADSVHLHGLCGCVTRICAEGGCQPTAALKLLPQGPASSALSKVLYVGEQPEQCLPPKTPAASSIMHSCLYRIVAVQQCKSLTC